MGFFPLIRFRLFHCQGAHLAHIIIQTLLDFLEILKARLMHVVSAGFWVIVCLSALGCKQTHLLKICSSFNLCISLGVFGWERSPQPAAEAHEKPANLFFEKQRCPYGNVSPPSSLPLRTPHLQWLWVMTIIQHFINITWLFIFTSLNNQWKARYEYHEYGMYPLNNSATAAPGS